MYSLMLALPRATKLPEQIASKVKKGNCQMENPHCKNKVLF